MRGLYFINKKIKKYLEDYQSAVKNLEEAFVRPSDDVVVDAAIKRFELG